MNACGIFCSPSKKNVAGSGVTAGVGVGGMGDGMAVGSSVSVAATVATGVWVGCGVGVVVGGNGVAVGSDAPGMATRSVLISAESSRGAGSAVAAAGSISGKRSATLGGKAATT